MLREPFTNVDVPAVRTEGLTKRYGDTVAVDRLDLEIPAGQFFGLLGPNGAGKTSTIHMLSTLIRPTQGRARVAGYDVLTHAVEVRSSIGVVFQDSALDRSLSVCENLRFAGLLHGLGVSQIRRRTGELLELFGLTEKYNEAVGTLSGGMRRALDIARGVIHQPKILFLDEPTIGLDVPNRRRIWRFIARLRADAGVTVLLTTHYLEEAADCERVAFVKSGRIVASGHPGELVRNLAAYIIEVEGANPAELAQALSPMLGQAMTDGEVALFRFNGSAADLARLQGELAERVSALRWRRPNLNDVFLWVTQTDLSRGPHP